MTTLAERQTILVVDDLRVNAMRMRSLLEPEWEVQIALSGPEALEVVTRPAAPDLILLDLQMPGMNGHEVCRRLKGNPETREIPVIFITAMEDWNDEAQGLALGAADYITKPVHAPIVQARIRNQLALRNAQAELARKNQELERLAVCDRLTGLYNRRKLDERLEQELTRAARYNRPLSVIMLDLDHFKEINDTCGHPAGDTVLAESAVRLKRALRKNDTVGRWGGEEFLILCPETGLRDAAGLAERLRQTFADRDFPEAGRLTASFGVAACRAEDQPNKLLSRADRALYRAKKSGRNRVEQEGP
ncbi:MAG TPA: diguanylate cyclase [Tichowtungia sp.]|nr:diguanylate cyclase [Tichowtungia sp.]